MNQMFVTRGVVFAETKAATNSATNSVGSVLIRAVQLFFRLIGLASDGG